MITLSSDQQKVLEKLLIWFKSDHKKSEYITLGGYAGTGKTTLISTLRDELHRINPKLAVAFVSYTGKATRVLKTSLSHSKIIQKKDTVSTIHSLVYSPLVNDREEITGWKRKDAISAKLIIIDEASMVNQTMWRDLLSFNIPIIAVGDHGQLPPIEGSFSLMKKPMLKLERIHRQAADNPIIELSIQARTHGSILPGNYGKGIRKIDSRSEDSQELVGELLANYKSDTLVLCGYNNTRVKLNTHIRTELGFSLPTPMIRDRVICLRNNHKKQIFNGMMGTIESVFQENEDWYSAEIIFDEDHIFKGPISAKQFNEKTPLNYTDMRKQIMRGDLFDFGYAITVHKAQGSQARRVILFEQRFSKMDDDMWKRWLYTAVTRAEEELVIIGKP